MKPQLPAYGRGLRERRKAAKDPWLVVVAIGALSYRKEFFAGDDGVAHMGVPSDAPIERLDWSLVVALDVLVAVTGGTERQRVADIIGGVWRAAPATVWQVDTGVTGTLLHPFRGSRNRLDFVAWTPSRVPLDHTFRAAVLDARKMALLLGHEPLYSKPEFDELRRLAA